MAGIVAQRRVGQVPTVFRSESAALRYRTAANSYYPEGGYTEEATPGTMAAAWQHPGRRGLQALQPLQAEARQAHPGMTAVPAARS
ncbi:hypothetical protein AYO44_05690 [Planctomycetaceae bacterium SCGC AG-212-F19]|nr:hypothetical protein AYO44_05690 [Planctomycetaceae bacterium SCGC AG-212-F19]